MGAVGRLTGKIIFRSPPVGQGIAFGKMTITGAEPLSGLKEIGISLATGEINNAGRPYVDLPASDFPYRVFITLPNFSYQFSLLVVGGNVYHLQDFVPQVGDGDTSSSTIEALALDVAELKSRGTKVIYQTSPSASWRFDNPMLRLCDVAVYVDNEQVEADVSVSPETISVTLDKPRSGVVVVN